MLNKNSGKLGNNLDQIRILGVPINKVGFLDVLKIIEKLIQSGRHHQIATVNPEFIMHSQEDKEFKEALIHSSLNTADGIGILWASKFIKLKVHKVYKVGIFNSIKNIFWLKITLLAILFNRKWLSSEIPERVTGVDLMRELANRAQERNWKVSLVAWDKGRSTADEVAEKLKVLYPKLNIVGKYDGSPEEEGIVEKIAKTKSDILFISFGSPKQEKFIYKNLGKLKAKVVIGVGGSFDFISGKAKRAPGFMRKIGLEWLWRFLTEPKRVQRIFNAFPRFVWKVYKS